MKSMVLGIALIILGGIFLFCLQWCGWMLLTHLAPAAATLIAVPII
jgi:hypothetical protein